MIPQNEPRIKRKMNDTTFFLLGLIGAILLAVILVVINIIYVGFYLGEPIFLNTTEAYQKCCGGNLCSDTYYDNKNNRCVYSLCEQSIFTTLFGNKSDCYYAPR